MNLNLSTPKGLIVQHPRATVQFVDGVTPASVERAKRAQMRERAWGVAVLIANYQDLNLRDLPARVQAHRLAVAMGAILDSKKTPGL